MSDLNQGADLDTSQVEDVRGAGGGGFGGGGGGGRLPIPIPIGGGKIGLIVTAIVVLGTLVLGGTVGRNVLGGSGGGGGDNTSLNQKCATSNPNRFSETDCKNVLYVNSVQAYWQVGLPQTFGVQYQKATTRFFSSQIDTGCGPADSGVGPFYCPQDRHVYIDLTFYDELANRFGAKGEFAQPYVLAHEYGHHVQNLLGTQDQVSRAEQRDPGSANQYSVKLELQADCYAGVWFKHAPETTDLAGHPLFKQVTQQDFQEAVDAAGAIGDDTIQKKMGGGVDESKFTHGTSAQRQQWLTTGYSTGNPKACNTFG